MGISQASFRTRRQEGVAMTEQAADSSTGDDGDYVHFQAAGDHVKGVFRCADCGYGVTISRELPVCPMCAGTAWEESEWTPFARATGALH
jgi:rubrerythrin